MRPWLHFEIAFLLVASCGGSSFSVALSTYGTSNQGCPSSIVNATLSIDDLAIASDPACAP